MPLPSPNESCVHCCKPAPLCPSPFAPRPSPLAPGPSPVSIAPLATRPSPLTPLPHLDRPFPLPLCPLPPRSPLAPRPSPILIASHSSPLTPISPWRALLPFTSTHARRTITNPHATEPILHKMRTRATLVDVHHPRRTDTHATNASRTIWVHHPLRGLTPASRVLHIASSHPRPHGWRSPHSCVSGISAETPSRARRGRAAAAGFVREEGAGPFTAPLCPMVNFRAPQRSDSAGMVSHHSPLGSRS